jgi:4-amino-4-deoxy-L-arabinose transferase-like glycosyltransferase
VSRRDRILLVALLILETVLVWGVFVPSPHPGGDNAGYVALAHSIHTGQGYTEIWDPSAPPHTKYPPVFPFLLTLAMTLGATGWVGLKLVPAGLAVVAVVGTFLWARRRLGALPAFGVALLVGLSPSLLYHSHWILSDVPFLAFTMLALWALEDVQVEDGASVGDQPGPVWGIVSWSLAAGVAGVFLAYFTRSAGLPLLVSAVGVLALRRRWRAAVAVAGGVGVPALAWLLRNAAVGPGEGRYASEFFLLDPYQPDLGRAGLGDLVQRLSENAVGYGGRFLPETLFGGAGPFAVALGLLVTALAAAGWVRSFRRGPGVAELFVPLYAGLILIWPQVWSGDRFALPLLPPLLVFGVEGAQWAMRDVGESARRWILVVAAVVVAAPGLQDWFRTRADDAVCRGAVEAAGPWACGGGALVDFVAAARWAGSNLPEGRAALTRKPRIWYLMSGVPTRTYPFTEAPGVLLEEAAGAGAGYVILDYVGNQGSRYVGAALGGSPERFCQLGVFGRGDAVPPTRLLQVVPDEDRYGSTLEEDGIRLSACPGPPAPAVITRTAAPGDWRIPILDSEARR